MKRWRLLFCVTLLLPGVVLCFAAKTGAGGNREGVYKPTILRFRIDPAKSKFMVKAHRGGLAWFKGHDHLIAVREFSGTAELDPNALDPASLEMTIQAASLEETSDAFTSQQKAIINNELKEIVLETSKYPTIAFKSTVVKGELKDGAFKIRIGGDITLHGVTRHIDIPAKVSLEGGELHAKGEFSLNRSDFNVKATSAFHGFVRVRNKLSFTFDITGRPD